MSQSIRLPESSFIEPAVPSVSAAWPMAIGYGIIILFFGCLGGWAAFAPLNGAVVAEGVVALEGNRKTIQSLDGGIVQEVLVKEGDRVKAGEVLARFEDTALKAQVDIYTAETIIEQARLARIAAELAGSDDITFPADLVSNPRPEATLAIRAETLQFEADRTDLRGSQTVLQQRIGGLKAQIQGDTADVAAAQAQLESTNKERQAQRALVDGKLATSDLLADLDRTAAALDGKIADAQSAAAAADASIAEDQQQILQLANDHYAQLSGDRADAQAKLLDLAPRLAEASAALARATVRSPTEGTVLDLKVFTPGGVVAPGGALLDVVPEQDRLVIEVRVHVEDANDISVGQRAQVKLTSYDQRTVLPIEGTVEFVSADRIVDERTSAPYYKVKIGADPHDLAKDPTVRMTAGMPATVLITTKQRTALNYLLGPLMMSVDKAFRQR